MVLTQKVCVQLQEGRSLCFVVPAPCPSMHANQRMQKTTVQFTGGKAKKKKPTPKPTAVTAATIASVTMEQLW